MSRFKNHILSTLILFLFFSSCATYDAQYEETITHWDISSVEINSEIDHTFYLLGDGGVATKTSIGTHFSQLKKDLSESSENSTLLFLGDNVYEHGMPKKTLPERKGAEEILMQQISLSDNFKGNTIFIPGNHDYYSDGIKGLDRQAKFITKQLDDKDAFLPKDGCPLKKVNISENAVLIIVDTQWYLENWDDNPTINDNCEIKTREQFFEEFEGLLKKNATKTIVLAMHHPMFTNGSHGGQYSMRQQLYPINNKIPLPIIGSVINLIRKTSGISPQDLQNLKYQELKKRIVTLSQKADKTIFVSGHEHNLQYLVKDNKPQIISGSTSKSSPARTVNGGLFSYGGIGYAKLILYKDKSSWVYYYSEENGKQKLLFKTKIHDAENLENNIVFADSIPTTYKASIYTKDEISKSKSFTKLMGDHYRTIYGTSISAPTVNLDTLFGGLIPTRKGGGHQSRSLRLEDKNGKEYVMRALKKSATQYFQSVAFKDEHIEDQYDDTYTESLMLDFYTAAHPYTPFVIGDIADAIDVYHTNPTLYYIPKQKTLNHFNADFGDELYMIEERATSGHGDVASFGFSDKLISTNDMLKALRKSDNNQVDEDTYIRARLFDMLIGDWDRHQDQWRWAEFKDGKKKIYKPVPRDRDQAFSKFDGVLIKSAVAITYDISMMQAYDDEIRNVPKFNISGRPLDLALINQSTFKDWESQVELIQQNITDEVIESAFNKLPAEINDTSTSDIKSKLKGRLKNLHKIANEYYLHLEKNAIVKGTDKDNWFEIKRLDNGDTHIKTFNIKDDKKGTLIHDKIYSKNTTKEIWVYGLDDKDVFEVIGVNKNVIALKLIGGQNNDVYKIESGAKVNIYDFKSKKNTFTTLKGTKRLTDDYEINSYNYKKNKINRNIILPVIGYNPDDGINLGISSVFKINGYNRNPFSQQHSIKVSYYFATNGFDLMYAGEFANIINNWNLLVEAKFTSPNYSINFYGLGNETANLEDDFDDDYHRVRTSAHGVYPSLKWIGRTGGQFSFGALYESVEVEKTEGRYIETLPYVTDERQNYLGAQASYKYENKDNEAFPTLGLIAKLDTGFKTNLSNSDNFAFVTPSLGIAYKLNASGTIVLATKFKGHIIIGNNYEFYYGASIGGKNGLRGYRNQRFTGNRSYYQNTDIRFNLGKFKTQLVPLKIGISGGFDYGRVWLDNEGSNDWKASYGGGIWLIGASMVNINASVFNSKEGTYFSFGLGFGF